MFSSTRDGGSGRRIASVGVHHHRHSHWTEKGFRYLAKQRIPRSDITSPDEDRRVLQIRRTTRKHQAVNQPGHIVRRHGTVREQLLDV